jgi:hypothetical protein
MAIGFVCSAVIAVSGVVRADTCVQFEDFRGSKTGMFPVGWKPRNNDGRGLYAVQREGDVWFLRGHSEGRGVEADRPHTWNLSEFPVLEWKWRPRRFPTASNEKDGKNDSVLGVYVGFGSIWGSLKYVWSDQLASGTEFSVGFGGRTKMRVANAGRPRDYEWVTVRVNVASDLKRRFDRTSLVDPDGIAVLTDSDDTRSVAEGDYADFRLCKQ